MIDGVCWLFILNARVVLEKCPKKAKVLGVGEWFVPGGKVEPGEDPFRALVREVKEEWGVNIIRSRPLPILEGSRVGTAAVEAEHGDADARTFLMRPWKISVVDPVPPFTVDEGVELRWAPVDEALASPVPQVRMMVAAAMGGWW